MISKTILKVDVLTLIVMTLLLTNSLVLQAQELQVTGQVRHRSERVDKDFSDLTPGYGFSLLRSRLNMKFTNEKNYAFIQIQDSRKFGDATNTLTDGSADLLDFHQAYFVISDFVTDGLKVKLGRQEVEFANQRLIGSVGWHNVARSFDGMLLSYSAEEYLATAFSLKETEMSALGDIGDKDVRGVWVETSFLAPTRVDVFFINQNLNPGDVLDRNTFGVYSKGSYDLGAFKLSQEIDFAFQNGTNDGNNVSANLIGLRIKLAAKDTPLKYWVGFGYDVVSGDDPATVDDEAFNTLYATNHKYYGYMDYFLNVPANAKGAGLTDIVLSAGLSPVSNFSMKVDYHLMSTSQDVAAGSDIGSEIDVTGSYGYSKYLKIKGGIEIFTPGDVFKAWKGEDRSTKAFIMTIYNF